MNSLKTVFLLTLLTMILVGVGGAVAGSTGMLVMLVFSIIMNFVSYWHSDTMVLKAYKAQEVDINTAPELVKIVSGLARKAGLPMPKVYVINEPIPNAFATGRNPEHAAVAVTSGIMQLLSRDEMEGVLAHELSHIKHRDILISTIVATLAGLIATIGNIAQWGAIFGMGRNSDDEGNGGIVGLLVTIIVAPLAATLIQFGVSRSREYMADEEGGRMSGNPLALASALAKIDDYAKRRVMPEASQATAHMFIINPLSASKESLASLFSTHPSTESRIQKLKELAATLKKS
ncbi:MAG TPA: zinc metalloprotease HtpX [Candidatus Avacidaminococcus intestinavium]|uniref:Protease HtpX homolog n=1 Tax=Candidatus Avacidaminococcus intestinavium TaxID=2840684 RepID=A0A9D1MQ40_9FIRM|nr:zinc metalloprotease HtpX [Candidatus Avacidaminococcus intestinavium]